MMKVGLEPPVPAAQKQQGAGTASGRDQGFKSLLDQAQAAGEACQKGEETKNDGPGETAGEGGDSQNPPAQRLPLPEGLGILGELLLEPPVQGEGVKLEGEAALGKAPALPAAAAVPAEGPEKGTAQVQAQMPAQEPEAPAREAGVKAPVFQKTGVEEGGPVWGRMADSPKAEGQNQVQNPVQKEAWTAVQELGQEEAKGAAGQRPAGETQTKADAGPAQENLLEDGTKQALPQAASWREAEPLALREPSYSPAPETAGLSTSEPSLPEDLGQFLSSRLPPAGKELLVELEPAQLGKLTVRVVYEEGRALVSIVTENPKTLELLSRHSPQLAAILEENTGQATVVYTGRPGHQPQESFERQGQPQDNPQRDRQQENRRKREQTESFYQRFRLGLI